MDARLRRLARAASIPALLLVGGMLFGYLTGRLLGPALDAIAPEDPDPLWLALGLPALAFFAWISILVHEAGHAWAGSRAGLRFAFLTAGPLWLERGPSGWRARFNRLPAAWGGLALCVPTSERVERRAFERYFMGGPLASLALAFAALAAALATTRLLGPSWGAVGFALLGAMSIAIFAATALLPSAGCDGTRWRRLRRGESGARGEVAAMVLSGLSWAGTRPRHWPQGLIADLELVSRREVRPGAAMLIAEHNLDQGRPSEAVRRLEQAAQDWDSLPAMLRGPLALELAFALLEADEAPERARGWLERSTGALVERYRLRMVEAALAEREGDRDRAQSLAVEARQALAAARFPVGAVQLDQLDAIESRLRRVAIA